MKWRRKAKDRIDQVANAAQEFDHNQRTCVWCLAEFLTISARKAHEDNCSERTSRGGE